MAEVITNAHSATVTAGAGDAPAQGTIENLTVTTNSQWPLLNVGDSLRIMDQADEGQDDVYEIMIATVIANGTNVTWTVTRGAEGTTPHVHHAGWTAIPVITKAALDTRYSRTFVYTFPGGLLVHAGTIRLYVPVPMTIFGVRASIGQIASAPPVILQVNKNGSPLYTSPGNRPTIPAGQFSVVAALPDITSLAAGDYLTVDIVQVGAPAPGTDLTVQIQGEFA